MSNNARFKLARTIAALSTRSDRPTEVRMHHASKAGVGPAVLTHPFPASNDDLDANEMAGEILEAARQDADAMGGAHLYKVLFVGEYDSLLQQVPLRIESAESTFSAAASVDDPMVAHVVKSQEAMMRLHMQATGSVIASFERAIEAKDKALAAREEVISKLQDKNSAMLEASEKALSEAHQRELAAKSQERSDARKDKAMTALFRWAPILIGSKYGSKVPPHLIRMALGDEGEKKGESGKEEPAKVNDANLTSLVASLSESQGKMLLRYLDKDDFVRILQRMREEDIENLLGSMTEEQSDMLGKLQEL